MPGGTITALLKHSNQRGRSEKSQEQCSLDVETRTPVLGAKIIVSPSCSIAYTISLTHEEVQCLIIALQDTL